MSLQNTAAPEAGQAAASTRIQQHRRYLMCKPEHFTVSYEINPWMHKALPTDTAKAVRQWQTLYDTYLSLGHEVELIDPVAGLPDMVYTANGGFIVDGTALGVKFSVDERRGEERPFMDWFAAHGFEVVEPVAVQEGEGDILLAGETILAGYGFRSSIDSHREIADVFGREVVSLHLVNPEFYHLDTAISVLDPVVGADGVDKANIAYLPGAFDATSRGILEERFPDAIRVADADGAVFGLNSASDGRNVFISPRAAGYDAQLRERGYHPVHIDLSELLRGGGGIKCCTLELRGATR
ncbi:N-dimethylarginine dimethylaminohydrolase [Microbacterium protaetiae]|uniref:N-dimethylarginine dimethylaminohydrolase n=1 Tax=Microbacterium protaetiae TaxID=2509458 RepID=A0A4P6EDH4_9MICO|nr:dimethylargininase [Microbacterium protaetiae]QAY59119.1 N-dimethylarginine dimethylaminohydrolase [Microbacterium protaetiae]